MNAIFPSLKMLKNMNLNYFKLGKLKKYRCKFLQKQDSSQGAFLKFTEGRR